MADVLLPIIVFFGIPLVVFMVVHGKREERERERQRRDPTPRDPSQSGNDWYWDGTGRPGR